MSPHRALSLALLALVLQACGGAVSSASASHEPRGPEEVTTEWTVGDDAPLGAPPTPQGR
jgi:hypothetical protein